MTKLISGISLQKMLRSGEVRTIIPSPRALPSTTKFFLPFNQSKDCNNHDFCTGLISTKQCNLTTQLPKQQVQVNHHDTWVRKNIHLTRRSREEVASTNLSVGKICKFAIHTLHGSLSLPRPPLKLQYKDKCKCTKPTSRNAAFERVSWRRFESNYVGWAMYIY